MLDAFGVYHPRRTPLHLLPPWVKLIGLALSAVAIFILRGPTWTLVGLVASLAVLASTLPPPRPTLRGLWPIALLTVLMGGYQWFRGDRAGAAEFAADFLAVACLALALTTSTRLDDAVSLLSRAFRPLRHRISPDSVGLVFALTARAIPEITTILGDSADAARARGLAKSPQATLVPAAVRTFGWALGVGEAITARGLADDPEPDSDGETPEDTRGNVEYPRRRPA
ncbi:MAG: energy-coupling factor transporter transmembrane protein EcfT [Demequinaceae bacterium]|nr:energy-coupling factor transporter transmembrane protein EcfT [Demequinaceae bacterium]